MPPHHFVAESLIARVGDVLESTPGQLVSWQLHCRSVGAASSQSCRRDMAEIEFLRQ